MTSSPSSSRPRLPQPSFAALLLAGAGLFLFFAATNVQSGWLFALDALLWAIWAWDLVMAGRRLPPIKARRLIPTLVPAGEPISLVVSLVPAGPLQGVEVLERGLDRAGTAMPGTGLSLGYVREAAAGETVTVRGTLTVPERGLYHLTGLHLIRYGPLGLFRRRQTLALDDPLWVHPPVAPWADGLRQLGADGDATGTTRRLGAVGLFAGVRDYRPGDSLRQIHWPLTARRGELSVKELEPPPAMRLTLVLHLQGDGPDTEGAVLAAGNLAAAAWEHGVPLTLVGPRPAWEPAHWGEVLEWLAEVTAGPLPDLPADPGAIVLVCDKNLPTGWNRSVAAAYGPPGASHSGAPLQPWPDRVKASLSV